MNELAAAGQLLLTIILYGLIGIVALILIGAFLITIDTMIGSLKDAHRKRRQPKPPTDRKPLTPITTTDLIKYLTTRPGREVVVVAPTHTRMRELFKQITSLLSVEQIEQRRRRRDAAGQLGLEFNNDSRLKFTTTDTFTDWGRGLSLDMLILEELPTPAQADSYRPNLAGRRGRLLVLAPTALWGGASGE